MMGSADSGRTPHALGLTRSYTIDGWNGRRDLAAPQARDPLDELLDVGIVDVERTGMGGGVREVIAASAAPALGKGDVMRLPIERQVAAILAVLGVDLECHGSHRAAIAQ